MKRILVLGATGSLGKFVIEELRRQGYWIRILSRSSSKLRSLNAPFDESVLGDLFDPKSLESAVSGIDSVISCAGASLDLRNFRDKHTFEEINFTGNRNVLSAAVQERVSKFIYVSFLRVEGIQKTEYIQSHEKISEAIRKSGLPYTIVRPTAFFSILLSFLKLAKKGIGVVLGEGKVRINPIHEKDVAKAVVEALKIDLEEMNIGGPDVFTRDEITELALRVAGKDLKLFHIPIFLNKVMIRFLQPFNQRIFQFLRFGNVVHTLDVVGPKYGTERLENYFRENLDSV